MHVNFDALNDSARRLVVGLLAREGELCVCEIVAALEEVQPKVSRHLRILREGGWVASRREGTWMHYRIADIPSWARKIVSGLVEGGVPGTDMELAVENLRRFDGRPPRAHEVRPS